MKLPRLATLIIGLSFIFGLMLWLVNSIYRLYIQIAFTAPILANILLLLIIGLLGLLIYVLLYYFYLLPQHQKKSPRVTFFLPSTPKITGRKNRGRRGNLKSYPATSGANSR